MVKYEFVTGEVVEVEVSEELSEVIFELENSDFKEKRKETRRHVSIDGMEELGFQFADRRFDLEEIVEVREEIRELYAALEKLLPKQRELVKKVYFEEKNLTSIAHVEKVNKSSVYKRLERIHKQIKKNF